MSATCRTGPNLDTSDCSDLPSGAIGRHEELRPACESRQFSRCGTGCDRIPGRALAHTSDRLSHVQSATNWLPVSFIASPKGRRSRRLHSPCADEQRWLLTLYSCNSGRERLSLGPWLRVKFLLWTASKGFARAGYYRCENSVQVGRPQSKEEVLGLIAYYDRVKGVGVGHSWWREQFCSGNDSTSINIVMTELESTLNL